MSNRVTAKALKAVALVGMFAGAAALSGCTALGGRAFADNTVTGSTAVATTGNAIQPMPGALKPTSSARVAAGPFIPPSDIGGGGSASGFAAAPVPSLTGGSPQGSIQSQDLPVLTSSTSSQGNSTPMSAQPSIAPVQVAAKPSVLGTPAPVSASPNLVAVPSDAYVHVIESGESLYTIARRYDVTAQAIIQANGFSSPDKIYVGQKIVIPGRKDLLAAKGPAKPVTGDDTTAAPDVQVASVQPNKGTPIENPSLIETDTPVTTASVAPENKPLQQPAVEPVASGDKFRWPVSGRVITDFANSKGTGINIEAPEGAAIRAAENGQVIYVGNGVEGYGNLILVRHPNGYVSAYAHLKDMKVSKGDVVNRGDQLGTAGMTGSVSRPQLHFELRKGATPVDPIPLLAS
jgi:murein DD-endopeptidase MepM/ murein hydrolase activator NlpD